MQILAAKLLDLEHQKRQEELAELGGEQRQVDFGSQIRSYVLQPYQMVKDLRTEHEVGNVDCFRRRFRWLYGNLFTLVKEKNLILD